MPSGNGHFNSVRRASAHVFELERRGPSCLGEPPRGAANGPPGRHVDVTCLLPNDVFGYVLEEAWICGWKGAEMDGLGREYAVERISIAYDSVSRGKA